MDFIKKVQSINNKVNPYYDMDMKQWRALATAARDNCEAVHLGFLFGYFQGIKAAKAAVKKIII